mgnify:CR=1 FL=1
MIGGRRYLTNIHRQRHDIIAEAIRLSSRPDIHISQNSIPGTQVGPDYFSVWVETDCDCSDFWQAYESLLQEPRWKVYLAMTHTG